MSDRRYFQSTKRGEIQELKDELHSANKDRKKEAVKKVIAAMTIGKDVSSLFPDVVNCMQTGCIELKKLVYLYVINYAKVQPKLAILAVNTFFKDSMDPNPLIRSLAIRTMGYIRLEQITEYLVEPLRRCCNDQDPYVRKTAAICIAKLYDISPSLMEEQGFFCLLKEMLADQNAMVVANTVSSLLEIHEMYTIKNRPSPKFGYYEDNEELEDLDIVDQSAKNLCQLLLNEIEKKQILIALNECTEWGQIYILDMISEWQVNSEEESKSILERITSRLSHVNPAVVLAAIRAVLKLISNINKKDEIIINTMKKLKPPLITLLTTSLPEVQYVILRNVQLIVQFNPCFLQSEYRVFYCKYNDPIYIKIEKLNILFRLANIQDSTDLLAELKEYSTDTDIDFARNSIRVIGRLAIKIQEISKDCIDLLIELITENCQDHIIQESIISFRDILRCYPNLFNQIISSIWDISERIIEYESRAAFVWIIGEFYEYIEAKFKENSLNNSQSIYIEDYLQNFVDVFLEENLTVQLQIITCIVKCFLKSPLKYQQLVTDILKIATTQIENPDIRDKAYIYWRLLSSNPENTRRVILSHKPTITTQSFDLEPYLLKELLGQIGLTSSVYHKIPSLFVSAKITQSIKNNISSEDIDDFGDNDLNINNNKVNSNLEILNLDSCENNNSKESITQYQDRNSNHIGNNITELLDLETTINTPIQKSNINTTSNSIKENNEVTNNTVDLLSL
ncbi:AP-2 complex beta subunit protein [Cryptosporidium andersoni]|uniref:AP complex subunit beta n=1 Tax=Cryptosporidium andersoni TaxID=117008 RepID=A0A1J4MQA9_9CRYT|nr:AP-2 complex beta subunit protein [Cryptosporidium andersoni]